jgi:hypothetical protein
MKGMVLPKFSFDKTMQLVALTLYTAFTGILLVWFGANILVTLFFLSVIPLVVLWRMERLESRLLLWLLLISFVGTVLFGATGYINGIWYELSPSGVRVFDLIPIEAFLASFIHWLYFIVVYEYFFDDKESSSQKTNWFNQVVIAGSAVVLGLGLTYVYLFSNLILTNAFALLVLALGGVAVVALALARSFVSSLLAKTALFSLAVFPISLIYEYVSLSNNIRFFANANEYIYSFTLWDQLVPLEELLFLLLLPFVMALVYELYADDGQ